MPLALVMVNEEKFKSSGHMRLSTLSRILRGDIAKALTCDDPGGQLAPGDVEVHFLTKSPYDVGGENYDLQVTVFASDFPSRRANLAERSQKLRECVKDLVGPRVHGYVWIRLAPAAFAEF